MLPTLSKLQECPKCKEGRLQFNADWGDEKWDYRIDPAAIFVCGSIHRTGYGSFEQSETCKVIVDNKIADAAAKTVHFE